MNKYQTATRIGPDGVLTLPVPPDVASVNAEVRVTVEPVAGPGQDAESDRAAWLAFIRRTAGSITDPTLERPPQGELQERDPFP